MPDNLRSGSTQKHGSIAHAEFRLEQARAEVHSLTRQLVKLRVIVHKMVQELPPERAAKLLLDSENARS